MLQTADVDAKVIVMVAECHPVSGLSYCFAAVVVVDLVAVADAEVTAADLAATTVCGSSYFFSAVVAADSAADAETTTDVDANSTCK